MIRIIFPLLLSVATLLSGPVAAQTAIEIADDAPDSYTVVRGDTLWDISGRFLKQPWRWPEVWRLNREQIRNPHLIYPGQIIFLDRSGPWLAVGQRIGEDKLEPRIYSEPATQPIPSIPLEIIEPFLTAPLVVDDQDVAGSAVIIANDGPRVYAGGGDTVFARNADDHHEHWQVYRKAEALVDPVSKEVLGYQALHLGTARVSAGGDVTTLQLVRAHEEIGVGDLMLPSVPPSVFSYMPRAPEADFEDGRVIAIHRGVEVTGANHVVVLNVGEREGLENGHVLALWRNRGSARFEGETIELPQHRYGLAFVFRVFDRVAYALVMNTDGQVTVGDGVRKP